MSTFPEVANLIALGTSESLSRAGKNEASRSRSSHASGTNAALRSVTARTVTRRVNSTKGVSRSSYLQHVADTEGAAQAAAGDDGDGGERRLRATLEDDGHRREMCSSPRLHPGLQLERLRDYKAARNAELSRIVLDDAEFARVQLRDEGTCLPGTAPVEQAWTPRPTRDVSAEEAEAVRRAARERDGPRQREERLKPGTYYTGRRPVKMPVPGVGHSRPRFDCIETGVTGGYMTPRDSAAPVTRHAPGAAGSDEGSSDGAATSPRRLPPISHSRAGAESGKVSPTHTNVSSGAGAGAAPDAAAVAAAAAAAVPVKDPHSHGFLAKRPPFGVRGGFRAHDANDAAANSTSDANGASTSRTPRGGHAGGSGNSRPEHGDYWPRPDVASARAPCFVSMAKDSRVLDRNPPAIPAVDITYPGTDAIALSLKQRTPHAFIAPLKPTDPPAHASTVFGHHAEPAWIANAAAAAGAGVSAPGDRLDIDPYLSRDALVKHSASMVDFARSAKKSVPRTLPTDTSKAEMYSGQPAPSAKRAVCAVNMDRMPGRPPVVDAPDYRAIDVDDSVAHSRPPVVTFAPLQPPVVALRVARLRAEREGAPRLCGASDISPLRPRVGAGAVDFSLATARKDPTSGCRDLDYDNTDPANLTSRRRVLGDPMLATTVSRAKREQLARPTWSALDRIYDTTAGDRIASPHPAHGALYEFDRRVDRARAFAGRLPSEAFLKRTTEGRPGPCDYAGEIVPPLRTSPGRSFTRANK
jgi:hypothetical protein